MCSLSIIIWSFLQWIEDWRHDALSDVDQAPEMSWLAEDLNKQDHYVGLIYSLKHRLNVQVKMAHWQYSMGFIIRQRLCRKRTLQKIKQMYIQGKELFLQNLLNGWRDLGHLMEDEFCFKLQKESEYFLQIFAEGSGLRLSTITFW